MVAFSWSPHPNPGGRIFHGEPNPLGKERFQDAQGKIYSRKGELSTGKMVQNLSARGLPDG
jgi:hypothetical protein